VGHTPPHDPEDEYDNLAALDFYTVESESDGSDVDALDDYFVPDGEANDTASGLGAIDTANDAEDDDLPEPVFTVTNPPGTVTATTFLDGRVQRIDLSPKVTAMTETHLAEEIVVIANLAIQDARAAQYAFMLEGIRQHGHDDVATRDFLTRDLELPSPEQAKAARAEIFATRYLDGDHA
jgi:hypothetical protein